MHGTATRQYYYQYIQKSGLKTLCIFRAVQDRFTNQKYGYLLAKPMLESREPLIFFRFSVETTKNGNLMQKIYLEKLFRHQTDQWTFFLLTECEISSSGVDANFIFIFQIFHESVFQIVEHINDIDVCLELSVTIYY